MATKVIPEINYVLNTQYNSVRSDVLSHTHNGVSGTKIKYSSLAWDDGLAPTGISNSMEKIDSHVGSLTNHGIPDTTGMLGSLTPGLMVQCGYNALSISAGEGKSLTVNFEKAYSSAPVVIASFLIGHDPVQYISINVDSIDVDKFTVYGAVNWQNYVAAMSGFYWIAIGQA